MTPYNDEYWMKLALKEAGYAYEEDEVPIGAVIVCNNKIIGKGYNQTERLHDVTAHAEMIAITAAANYLGAKFLEDCTLYVTIEPCPMCAAALRWARVRSMVLPIRRPAIHSSGRRCFIRRRRSAMVRWSMSAAC